MPDLRRRAHIRAATSYNTILVGMIFFLQNSVVTTIDTDLGILYTRFDKQVFSVRITCLMNCYLAGHSTRDMLRRGVGPSRAKPRLAKSRDINRFSVFGRNSSVLGRLGG